LSDETPEALLRSALEKIVYFEARSNQLTADAEHLRAEVERLKGDLAAASQREIELRRVIAELEVRVTRAHAEREEMARVADALRRERAELIGKMLEASRIHGQGQLDDFDLAQFIAQLRSEVLLQRDGGPVLVSRVQDHAAPATPPASVAEASAKAEVATASGITAVAAELRAQGRLAVNDGDLARLVAGQDFPGRSEETLFGFSVRELSAPDAGARARAAERLEALGHAAAAPALATALHGETEPQVQVALLSALSSLAHAEAVPVVKPLLTSGAPEVRIAALKALLTLEPSSAAPHLAAATKDPDKAVRRRASLLALGLEGAEALELGTQAIRDADADVRALAALVLGASQVEAARPMLLEAMCDRDLRVRRAAAQSLSRLLGHDVTNLVTLDEAHLRREVRRVAQLPVKKVPPLAAPPRAKVTAALAQVGSGAAGRPAGASRVASSPGAALQVEALSSGAAVASPAREPRAAAPEAASVSVAPTRAPAGAWALEMERPALAVEVAAATPRLAAAAVAAHEQLPAPVAHGVRSAMQVLAPEPQRARVAVLEVAPAAAAPAELAASVLRELRASIRGRPLQELADGIGASVDETLRVCGALMADGQVVRRGHKYFVA
jgi:hypothetical protein